MGSREHLSEAGSGLDEAAKALEAVRLRLIQGCNLACYQQLGFYKILLDTRNQELLHTIYREILAPLLAYDQRSGGALIATLRCYLKYLNLSLAAKELFIHRHTLRYRLEQIESLTGLQPNKPAHAFQLQMALMIHDFLMARHQDHS